MPPLCWLLWIVLRERKGIDQISGSDRFATVPTERIPGSLCCGTILLPCTKAHCVGEASRAPSVRRSAGSLSSVVAEERPRACSPTVAHFCRGGGGGQANAVFPPFLASSLFFIFTISCCCCCCCCSHSLQWPHLLPVRGDSDAHPSSNAGPTAGWQSHHWSHRPNSVGEGDHKPNPARRPQGFASLAWTRSTYHSPPPIHPSHALQCIHRQRHRHPHRQQGGFLPWWARQAAAARRRVGRLA